VDPVQLLALIGCIFVALLLASRQQAIFVVRIRQGRAEGVRGTVTPAFLAEVEQLCAEQGIQSGEVRGVARGRRIALSFSGRLPRGFCQRLRNWWAMSGWTGRPTRA